MVADRGGSRVGPVDAGCARDLVQAAAAPVPPPVHDRARGSADAFQRRGRRVSGIAREEAGLTIRQVLFGAGPVDAVTQQALEYRRLLGGEVYAAAIEPAIRSEVKPLRSLQPEPGDLLVFHYSAYAPRLEPLLELPQRKLLVYHNVTPAEWLWEHQPHVATLCALGREHLPRWARAVDVAAAVSDYNASDLRAAGAREVRVVPVLMDPARVGAGGASAAAASGTRVLSVGRLAATSGRSSCCAPSRFIARRAIRGPP